MNNPCTNQTVSLSQTLNQKELKDFVFLSCNLASHNAFYSFNFLWSVNYVLSNWREQILKTYFTMTSGFTFFGHSFVHLKFCYFFIKCLFLRSCTHVQVIFSFSCSLNICSGWGGTMLKKKIIKFKADFLYLTAYINQIVMFCVMWKMSLVRMNPPTIQFSSVLQSVSVFSSSFGFMAQNINVLVHCHYSHLHCFQ